MGDASPPPLRAPAPAAILTRQAAPKSQRRGRRPPSQFALLSLFAFLVFSVPRFSLSLENAAQLSPAREALGELQGFCPASSSAIALRTLSPCGLSGFSIRNS